MIIGNRLTKEAYQEDAIIFAQALLGKILVRKFSTGEELRYMITETEAYYGEEDTACHAHKGKTQRTAIMYQNGGYAYIYMCYGIHFLLNIVTGPTDHPEAVLIRGIEGYNGPGKLTKHMDIAKELNRIDLVTSNELWIEDNGTVVQYETTKRIGIDYATKEYRDKHWRYIIKK